MAKAAARWSFRPPVLTVDASTRRPLPLIIRSTDDIEQLTTRLAEVRRMPRSGVKVVLSAPVNDQVAFELACRRFIAACGCGAGAAAGAMTLLLGLTVAVQRVAVEGLTAWTFGGLALAFIAAFVATGTSKLTSMTIERRRFVTAGCRLMENHLGEQHP